MDAKVLKQIRESLLEKRDNLTEWLRTTPPRKTQARLGPADEQALHTHLHVLDTALEKAASGTLGVCTVCHGIIEPDLLEMDYTACVCLEHLSAEEIRDLESELELAQSVQRSLLPQQVPDTPALEIAAFSRPAQIVTGDYFDFLRFQDGAQGLAIADVAGHGVSASLYMASMQILLRTLVPASHSPADVVRQVHHLLIHNVRFTTFVTLFLGSFDSSAHRLTYCNAGHNPPLVFRKGGGMRDSTVWLRPTGPAIGLVEGAEFRAGTSLLLPGDILLLYTDGVTEALNPEGEEFGRERLAMLVEREWSLSAKGLVGAIRHELQEFTSGEPLADDTTIVVCKIAD
jgi:sigma-B regulation protein RsbU (phosphoserine phosphatase)